MEREIFPRWKKVFHTFETGNTAYTLYFVPIALKLPGYSTLLKHSRLHYACPYVAIFNPRLFIFDLNLFAFKFKLHLQNLFKFKPNFLFKLFKLI